MTELSLEQRDALLELSSPEPTAVLDGRTLSDLRARGLAIFSTEGWTLTELGEWALDHAGDA